MEKTASQIRDYAPDTPVVFPIAAIEQHGPHLPVWTDTLILSHLVERVEASLTQTVLFAPLQWLGNSDHHLDFNGTLSAAPRVYLDLLNSLVENAIAQGFRRIVLLNGHGGNDLPGKQALFEARMRHSARADLLLLMGTYWNLGPEPWVREPALIQRDMGHACEWETSMVLAIRPDLVGEIRSLPAIDPGNPFRPGTRAWKTADRSRSGYIGSPGSANVDKGRALLDYFEDSVRLWLERVARWDGQSWDG